MKKENVFVKDTLQSYLQFPCLKKPFLLLQLWSRDH